MDVDVVEVVEAEDDRACLLLDAEGPLARPWVAEGLGEVRSKSFPKSSLLEW